MKIDAKKILTNVVANIAWKPIVKKIYEEAVRPELVKLVESTDNKLDDMVINALDYVISKFIAEEKKAEEVKEVIKAAV